MHGQHGASGRTKNLMQPYPGQRRGWPAVAHLVALELHARRNLRTNRQDWARGLTHDFIGHRSHEDRWHN